jgi:1-deoxy-D-xylulose-5-phosphate reductoisomerase
MVEFRDGSVIAQLSMPDMRLPIAYALGHPDRATVPYGRIDWSTMARLDFAAPDAATFRCLSLAYAAGRTGGTAPAWLSAANEVAVEAFLDGALGWADIAAVIESAMDAHDGAVPATVEDVLAADESARHAARMVLAR